MNLWHKISYLGLDENNTHLDREQILTNRINFLIACLLFAVSSIDTTVELLENGELPWASRRTIALTFICLFGLYAARRRFLKLSKISLAFFMPTILLVLPVLVFNQTIPEFLMIYPFLAVLLSGIPILIFDHKKEKTLWRYSMVYFLFLVIFVDLFCLKFRDGTDTIIWSYIKNDYIVYKAVHIAGFLFVTWSVLYLKYINKKYESNLKQTNKTLHQQSILVESQSKKLSQQNIELHENQKALKLAHDKIVEANEHNYKLLFELAADGIVILDEQGKVQMSNQNFCKLFKLECLAIQNQELEQIIPLDFWTDYLSLKLKKHTNELLVFEKDFNTEKLGKLIIEIKLHQLPDHRFQLFFHDITERKNAERTLKESELQLKNLFENSSDAILIYDSNFKILNTNQRFLELLKIESNDLIDDDIFSYLLGINAKKQVVEVLQTLHRGKAISSEYAVKNRFDHVFPVEARTTIISYKNQEVYFTSLNDISERKAMEKNISIASITSEENERGRLAKELHDGLGPLLSTAKIYLYTLTPSTTKEDFNMSVQKIGEIIEDSLLTIREISNNISPHILRNYGIKHAITSFIEKLHGVTTVQFNFQTNIDENRYSDVTETTIYRVFLELINNSLKHSKATSIKCTLTISNNELTGKYVDNGKGFDYMQTTQNKMGFGLINIEHRICSIGGFFNYFSAIGQGVTVDFKLKADQ